MKLTAVFVPAAEGEFTALVEEISEGETIEEARAFPCGGEPFPCGGEEPPFAALLMRRSLPPRTQREHS